MTDKISVDGVDRASIHRVSTFLPESSGQPNPMYDMFESIYNHLDKKELLQMLEASIVEGEDEEAWLERVLIQFNPELEVICDLAEDELELGVRDMPPAPNAAIMYNRVAEVPVVDIGSGDCKKLSKAKPSKVVATDINPQENPHFEVKKCNAEELELEELVEQVDGIVTSFNSLTQLADLSVVQELDGIHVFPDTVFIREELKAEVVGTIVKCGKYEDHIHEDLEEADDLSPGYKSISYYKARNASYDLVGYAQVEKFNFPVRDAVYFPSGKTTPKYDGVLMNLTTHDDGGGILRTKSGMAIVLEGSGPPMDLCLEKLPKVGKAQHYCLLRVLRYRNYVPFHGIKSLRNFVAKVKIKIGGVPIVAPTDDELSCYPADGLIFRDVDMDYRWKFKRTVDLEDPHKTVEKLGEEYGVYAQVEGYEEQCANVLSEFAVLSKDGGIVLSWLGRRPDKDTPTPLKTVWNYAVHAQSTS